MSERPVFENNLLLKPLVRQFDSVGMLLVALVLFRQDFFQPLCLLFCDPLIYRFWVVADEEFLPATVTPERSHLLEAYGFLAATLFYRHCLHVLILDELAILLAATSISLEICFVNLLKPLQPSLAVLVGCRPHGTSPWTSPHRAKRSSPRQQNPSRLFVWYWLNPFVPLRAHFTWGLQARI